MTGIAEGLARSAQVSVLCGQPSYSKRGVKAARRQNRNGVAIRRVWSTRLDKNTKLGRALNYLSVSGSLFSAALFAIRREDSVLVVTNPPTLPYVVAAASRLRGVPYWLMVHDIFPDLPIALGWFEKTSVIARLAESAARWLYRGAAGISVLGRDMAATVAETAHLPNGDGRVAVITNWADLDLIQPLHRSDSLLLNRLGLGDHFVVQFAGNIGPLQDVPTVVAAMGLLRNRPDIHLLVVGSGQLRPWLESEVKLLELKNVTVIDAVSRDHAGEVHQACDIAIVSLIDGMLGVSVPSRTYNFMAAGRPIIAAVDPDSEVGRTVAEEEVGWVVGSGDANALAHAVRLAADDPDRVAEMGSRARRVAEASYSRDAVVSAMARFLRLTGPGRHD